MTLEDKRRYYYLCEMLARETKDKEDLLDCLYRLRAERDAAFKKLAEICIEPQFRFLFKPS